MTDLILTWPKSRSLESYLLEMKRALVADLDINFRVPHEPKLQNGDTSWGQAYMVHDGAIRGYSQIIEVCHRKEGEVVRVESDSFAGVWPAGWYIVREPVWRPLKVPIPKPGFQGFRYVREQLPRW